MEKELTATAAAVPNNPTEAKCPVKVGARRNTVAGAPTNAGWWPDQLNLRILHQNSPLSDPMGKAFNYAEEFKSLDLEAVIKDLADAGLVSVIATLRPLLTYKMRKNNA